MRKKPLILVLVGVALVGTLAAAATPRLLHMTSTPQFCNGCHVMNDQYEAWFMTGVHRTVKCIDCHLPNDRLVSHLFWKSIDGSRDLIMFHSGAFVEPITISDRGKRFIKDNCIRCHGGVVSMIQTDAQACWSCHRRINHKAAIFNS